MPQAYAALPWESSPDLAERTASVGGMLGTLAVAFGVGAFAVYALDLHTHRCEACGHNWRHLGALNHGDLKAHTCSHCETVQWIKDGVPHVFREVLRTPPPKVIPDELAARLRDIGEKPRSALAAGPAATWNPASRPQRVLP